MNRKLIAATAVLMLFAAQSVAVAAKSRPAQASTAVPPSPPAATEHELPADLSRCFPEKTAIYAEVSNFESQFATIGGSRALYDQLGQILKQSGTESLPLSETEFTALTRSDIAVGTSIKLGHQGSGTLAIIRAPSAETVQLLRDALVRLLTQFIPRTKPIDTVVNGQSVVRMVAPGRPQREAELAYAVCDNALVAGSPWLVDRVFGNETETTEQHSLSQDADFAEARTRLVNRASSFMWFDPAGLLEPVARGARPDVDGGLIRVDSIRGLGVASTDAGGGETTLLLELDRTKESLITIVTDAPAITLDAAQVVPANMQSVVSFGLDLDRMSDFANRIASQGSKDQPQPATPGIIDAQVEPLVGMKLRSEFLPAIGNEVTIAFDFTETLAGVFANPSNAPNPHWMAVVPARDAEVAQRGFASIVRSFGGPGDKSVFVDRDFKNVHVAQKGSLASAVIGKYAILGDVVQVERAIEAAASETSLAQAPDVIELRSRLTSSTIAGACLTREYGAAIAKMLAKSPQLVSQGFPGATMIPGSFSLTVNKESAGIYCEVSHAGPVATAIVGIVAAIAIPSLLVARSAANESAAIGTMRMLASAEATYQSRFKRYGTMKQLVTAKYLDASFVDGAERNSYVFREVGITKVTFEFSAEPVGSLSRERSYNVIEDFVIRYSNDATPPRRATGKVLGMPDPADEPEPAAP